MRSPSDPGTMVASQERRRQDCWVTMMEIISSDKDSLNLELTVYRLCKCVMKTIPNVSMVMLVVTTLII